MVVAESLCALRQCRLNRQLVAIVEQRVGCAGPRGINTRFLRSHRHSACREVIRLILLIIPRTMYCSRAPDPTATSGVQRVGAPKPRRESATKIAPEMSPVCYTDDATEFAR